MKKNSFSLESILFRKETLINDKFKLKNWINRTFLNYRHAVRTFIIVFSQ